jgi:hypothetical protein
VPAWFQTGALICAHYKNAALCQNLDLQMNVLTKAGCERILTDQGVSGAAIELKDYPRQLPQSERVTYLL